MNKSIDKDSFRPIFKRLMRQLNDRARKVDNGQRDASYYNNKRLEFIELIDAAINEGWFVMPKEGTRIWQIYYDKFN